VQFSDLAVGDYVAKFGHERTWDREHELAKSAGKVARGDNRNPVRLLADYTFEGDGAAGALWQHYARTFKGKRQLAWSPGLRELLGLKREQTDGELAAAVDDGLRLLAVLGRDDWRRVYLNEARGELLQIAATGDAGRLWAFIRALPLDGGQEATQAAPGGSSPAAEWTWGASDILAAAGVLS
jgi:hypothetical protein